ncbi:MAG: PQQ-binding-like beta-propeller repeat protein, partial [Parvibaculaceae bacterium]
MILLLSIVLVVIGLLLAGGGLWLILLGGSWYYLLAGLGFLVAGVAFHRRHAAALFVFAVVTIGSLAWAILEAGLDWWSLAPRGGLIVAIGVLMVVAAWFGRGQSPSHTAWRTGLYALAAALVVSIVVALYSMTIDQKAIFGQVAEASSNALPPSETTPLPEEWIAYGRTAGGSHFSPLTGITPDNVGRLQRAWEYRTGDIRDAAKDPEETTYEVTPLMVGGLLYVCTPHQLAIALDPVTGAERWRFDPKVGSNKQRQHQTCRGLSYYQLDGMPADAECARRVLLPTADARLVALDARTGAPCRGFGNDGAVNLALNMPHFYPGSYYSTSPPVVANGLIVIGGAVNDNVSTTEPSGVIRAYRADTGALVWNFDSGKPDQTQPLAPDQHYVGNSPNAWSLLSVDAGLGLVYAPMGNAPPDQYGGARTPETERFSSSVTALDLATGQVRWVRQLVHHDLWDMDTPSQPQLVDLQRGAETVPALVQATKQGDIYVLDRRTGEPLLPTTEEPAPQGAVEGDFTAPTQPTSALTFKPRPLSENDMWGATML